MKRRIVLLVGDVANRASEIIPFCSARGIDVLSAKRAVDAIKMCWQFRIDTMILDAKLPDSSVKDFMTNIAHLLEKFQMNVFLVATDQEWDDVINSLPEELWPSGRVNKPVSPFEILYALKTQSYEIAEKTYGFKIEEGKNERAEANEQLGSRLQAKELPQSGPLRRYPPERLLVALGMSRFSGVVTFTHDNKILKLEFADGRPVSFLTRGIAAKSILELARELGLITTHAYKKIARLSEVRKIPAIQLLLDLHELTGEELESLYRIQDIQKIQRVFGSEWNEGEFKIESGASLGSDGKAIDINLGKLVVDGIVLYGDPKKIEAFFAKYGDTPFEMSLRTPFALSELLLSEAKAALVLKINGKTPISQLKLEGFEEMHTKPFLYALWVARFIKPIQRAKQEADEGAEAQG